LTLLAIKKFGHPSAPAAAGERGSGTPTLQTISQSPPRHAKATPEARNKILGVAIDAGSDGGSISDSRPRSWPASMAWPETKCCAIVAATMNARCEPSSRTRPRPLSTRSRRWTWARHRTVCWAVVSAATHTRPPCAAGLLAIRNAGRQRAGWRCRCPGAGPFHHGIRQEVRVGFSEPGLPF